MTSRETTFNVKEGTYAFFICVGPLSKETQLLVRIYGPDEAYKGYLMTGFNYPPVYYASSKKATMNAKRHTPISGVYKAQITCLGDDKNCLESEIKIVCNEEADKKILDYDSSLFSEMDLWEPEAKYYKGDLHAHTFLSDGSLNGDAVETVLRKQGLDFIALTDHNVVPMGFKALSALVIPSFELTLPKGHINIHGLKTPDIFGGIDSIEEFDLNAYLENLSKECHLSINHPFFKPWDFNIDALDISAIDSLELICDPTYPGSHEATTQAVHFFDYVWTQGLKIFGVGGSDSHLDMGACYESSELESIYGDPSTHVYSSHLTQEGIVEGLKKGRAIISRFIVLEVDYMTQKGSVLPGSNLKTIKDLKSVKVNIKSANYKPLTVNVIYNSKCVHTVVLENDYEHQIEYKFDHSMWEKDQKWHWVRLEVKNELGQWVGFVNPVYAGQSNEKSFKWGTLMEAYR